MVSEGSSDLHLRVGFPPVIRVHGTLQRVDGPPLRPEDSDELMRNIASEDYLQDVRAEGGTDVGFAFGDAARFRVSAFKEKGNFGLVLRQIPTRLLTLDEVGLPKHTINTLLHKPCASPDFERTQ
jgi:twitching motility protein PilT